MITERPGAEIPGVLGEGHALLGGGLGGVGIRPRTGRKVGLEFEGGDTVGRDERRGARFDIRVLLTLGEALVHGVAGLVEAEIVERDRMGASHRLVGAV